MKQLPCAGEVGVSLNLEHLDDRVLEGLFLFWCPAFALPLSLLGSDCSQNSCSLKSVKETVTYDLLSFINEQLEKS